MSSCSQYSCTDHKYFLLKREFSNVVPFHNKTFSKILQASVWGFLNLHFNQIAVFINGNTPKRQDVIDLNFNVTPAVLLHE